jgi:hypothetical protein
VFMELNDELRQMIGRNFQEQPKSHAIFLTLLLELSEAPAFEGLDSITAAERIFTRLERLQPQVLGSDSERARAEIQEQLKEFEDRQLIAGLSKKRLHLRFPHHLPILAAVAPAKLKSCIDILASTKTQPKERSLLRVESWSALRERVKDPKSCRAVVIASQWPEAAEHDWYGLPDRLGIEGRNTYLCADNKWKPGLADKAPTAFKRVTPELASEIVVAREGLPPPLLLGGAGLLRWALQQLRKQPTVRLECHALGRLSNSQLNWWFKSRGLIFEGSQEKYDSIDIAPEIQQCTAGVAGLVRLFNLQLEQDYQNIDNESRRRAWARYEQALPAALRELLAELNVRERRVLSLVAEISRNAFPGESLEHAVVAGENFNAHVDVNNNLAKLDPLDVYDDEDSQAILVVQMLGLVPTPLGKELGNPFEGLIAAAQCDPLFAFAAALEQPA